MRGNKYDISTQNHFTFYLKNVLKSKVCNTVFIIGKIYFLHRLHSMVPNMICKASQGAQNLQSPEEKFFEACINVIYK